VIDKRVTQLLFLAYHSMHLERIYVEESKCSDHRQMARYQKLIIRTAASTLGSISPAFIRSVDLGSMGILKRMPFVSNTTRRH
jgi:hypothetical protein